jgi:hypothetical protein
LNKLDEISATLESLEIADVTISEVFCNGGPMAPTAMYRGAEYRVSHPACETRDAGLFPPSFRKSHAAEQSTGDVPDLRRYRSLAKTIISSTGRELTGQEMTHGGCWKH